eukprot:g29271.t1
MPPAASMEEEGKKLQQSFEEVQERLMKEMLPVEKSLGYKDMSDVKMVHNCAERCQRDMKTVAERVQGELQGLQRSMQSCQNSVIERLNPKMESAREEGNAKNIDKIEKEFKQGVQRCMKDAQAELPDVEGRVRKLMKNALSGVNAADWKHDMFEELTKQADPKKEAAEAESEDRNEKSKAKKDEKDDKEEKDLFSPVRLPSRPSDRRVSTAALRPGAVPGRKGPVMGGNASVAQVCCCERRPETIRRRGGAEAKLQLSGAGDGTQSRSSSSGWPFESVASPSPSEEPKPAPATEQAEEKVKVLEASALKVMGKCRKFPTSGMGWGSGWSSKVQRSYFRA